jgi:hypothetical protein
MKKRKKKKDEKEQRWSSYLYTSWKGAGTIGESRLTAPGNERSPHGTCES